MAAINQAGRKLIENFEGLRLHAYEDSGGVWTIGYGHTGPDVHPGLSIMQARAEELLENDLKAAENGVSEALHVTVNPNQFAAMVSLAYNIGLGAFRGSSVLRLVNQKNWLDAAAAFLKWDDAGYPEQAGLDRRRKAECELFLQDLPK